MKTLTEISRVKFIEMINFCGSYKQEYGEFPGHLELSARYGDLRAKLFANMIKDYKEKVFSLDKLVRALLMDDGYIRYVSNTISFERRR